MSGTARAGLCVGGFGQDCLSPSPSGCTYISDWGLKAGISALLFPPAPVLAELPRLFSEDSRHPASFL